MIVLDTNVVSETLRPPPAATVLAWMRSEPAMALFTTTITGANLLHRSALLPDGRRWQPRSAFLATRNIADFADCGLPIVDPWV